MGVPHDAVGIQLLGRILACHIITRYFSCLAWSTPSTLEEENNKRFVFRRKDYLGCWTGVKSDSHVYLSIKEHFRQSRSRNMNNGYKLDTKSERKLMNTARQ